MYTAAVVTVSDRSFRGERPDGAGPVAAEMLEAAGYQVVERIIGEARARGLKAE